MPTAEELAKAKQEKASAEQPVQPDAATQAAATEAAATGGAKANDQNASKSKKDDVPEGWLSAVDFAKHWTKTLQERGELAENETIRPQYIYGYIRNTKGFPNKNHTDGRFIVPVEEATKFLLDRRTARASAKAEKEAKEKAAAEAAAAKQAETPAEAPANA
jgi:hypothetical protein